MQVVHFLSSVQQGALCCEQLCLRPPLKVSISARSYYGMWAGNVSGELCDGMSQLPSRASNAWHRSYARVCNCISAWQTTSVCVSASETHLCRYNTGRFNLLLLTLTSPHLSSATCPWAVSMTTSQQATGVGSHGNVMCEWQDGLCSIPSILAATQQWAIECVRGTPKWRAKARHHGNLGIGDVKGGYHSNLTPAYRVNSMRDPRAVWSSVSLHFLQSISSSLAAIHTFSILIFSPNPPLLSLPLSSHVSKAAHNVGSSFLLLCPW